MKRSLRRRPEANFEKKKMKRRTKTRFLKRRSERFSRQRTERFKTKN
jgi:hypothetical protein